jgi:hypothetical protein
VQGDEGVSGWQQQVETHEHPNVWVPPKGVIGIVVAAKFPDPAAIRTVLEDGFGRVAPETVWVMRENARKEHAVTFAWQTFKNNGIEPLLAPLVPAWKSDGMATLYDVETRKPTEFIGKYDMRADWRDIEMRATCERIIVFHDKSSNITKDWIAYRDNNLSVAKIYVVERGKVKVKKYRKGRNLD